MTEIPNKFPKPSIENNCICCEKEDMVHIYNCEIINQEKLPNVKYEIIFNETISMNLSCKALKFIYFENITLTFSIYIISFQVTTSTTLCLEVPFDR